MQLYLSFSILLMSTISTIQTRVVHLQNIRGGTEEHMAVVRIKRSLASIGRVAVGKLLEGTKLIFDSGLDAVFTKPGGFKKALKDFDSVNTAKGPLKIGVNAIFPVSKVGRVGDRALILRENPFTGHTILQISKVKDMGKSFLVEPTASRIILYTRRNTD